MRNLWHDLRYAVRILLKAPAFTLIAVLSLALGIGANAAIFSLVNAILLRPLAVMEPERLISVFPTDKSGEAQAFSYPNYVDFRDRNDVFTGLFVTRFAPMSLSRENANERIWGYLVSGNYFDVLGTSAAQGRTFLAEEDQMELSHPVAVLSHGCWQRRFGGDPALVGKDVTLNNHRFRVVGIMPEGFTGTEVAYTPELWVPVMMQEWIEPSNSWLDRRSTQNIFATGRLKPGVTLAQAEASLNNLARRLGEEYPDTNEGQSVTLTPPGLIHPMLRTPLISFTWALMALVGLVLLIACTNLANLLLARASERRKEVAIRLALGASRSRLVRQLLTESILLSVLGGAVGFLLAIWMIDLAVGFKPPVDFPLSIDLGVDGRVLGFSLLASLITGIIFGIVPALQSTKPELVPALKDATAQAGSSRSRLRSTLVVAQIALSLVLLIAAGLVVRALQQVQTMSPGFDSENGLIMSVDVGLQGYDETKGAQFYQQLVERVRSLPGVRSASLASSVPLSINYNSTDVYVEGQAPVRGANVPSAMTASVGTNYFETMRTPLIEGRGFGDGDGQDAPRVIVVNETFARRFFPGANPSENAIGKRVRFGGEQFWQIVGVARDGKYFSIGEAPRMFVYSPLLQDYATSATLIVRTSSNPERMISTIRDEVRKLDPNLPVFGVKTLTEHMGVSLFPARVAATLLGGFGLLALTLAGIGIYGVMAYAVTQRTREIGIRVALGARPTDVLRLCMRHGVLLSVIGVLIGLVATFALTRLMASLLYGVSPTDAVTFISISLLLTAVALLASYLPARRATKVDPMIALRHE
ncbi:MAG: ABC transporter permease [Pyrinomonadaceae bacterium]|nr:ABC transporter permease [Pyrinomonadaceae bacterium]